MAAVDCSELSKVITDLALMIGERPGMDTLDKVTAELKKSLPTIDRQMVVDSIVEATQSHRKAMTDVRKQVDALKREARGNKALEKQIAELERLVGTGKRPKGGHRLDRASDAIKLLREIRDKLKAKVGPSQATIDKRNEKRLKALNERLAGLEKNLAEGTEPAKKVKVAVSETQDIANVRKRIEEVKKEISESVPAQRRKLIAEIGRIAKKLESVENVPPVPRESLPVAKELEKLVFERDKAKRALKDKIRSLRPQSFFSRAAEPTNLARSIMTSMDLSAVFRQGGFLALSHPLRTFKSIKPMLQAFASEQQAHKINNDLQDADKRINAPLYARSKLFLASLDSETLNAQEEAFMSRLAGKIPLVGGSQRAYVTFLNVLRADAFDGMVETLGRDGEVSLEEAKAIANYINVATGRGPLGKKGEQAGPLLATLFFAPRLVTSRFQLLAGQPLFGGTARTRKLIARDYGQYLAGLSLVYLLASLAGGDPEEDPRSSDFGKVRFGKTRVDPLSGLSQAIMISARLATGERKSAGPDGKVTPIFGDVPFGSDDAFDVGAKFVRTKFSPLIGSGVNVITGKDVVGGKADVFTEMASLQTPLVTKDVLEAMEEHGVAKGTALGMLAILGMGVSTFGSRVDVEDPESLGKFVYSLTDPSDDGTGWEELEGVSEEDAAKALLADVQRRADDRAQRRADQLAKGKGQTVDKVVKAPKVRRLTKTGKPTAYGRRLKRMLSGMRKAKRDRKAN